MVREKVEFTKDAELQVQERKLSDILSPIFANFIESKNF